MIKKKFRNRTGLKQIAFDVPEEWHLVLKQRAKYQYKTMREYIIEAVEEKMLKEKELGY